MLKNALGVVRILSAIVCLVCSLTSANVMSEPLPRPTGTVAGIVTDSSSGAPLAGASIRVLGTDLRAKADDSGAFQIREIPTGRYSIQFSFIGYRAGTLKKVSVQADSVTEVHAELAAITLRGDDIIVKGEFIPPATARAGDALHLSQEELRHTAGFSEDVIRSVNSLPGIARVSDVFSTMNVRGGSASENGFYIDGIPVPDINHLPMHGSSGGAVGLVNDEVVKDVRLNLGGFDASYGGRLSSITELTFREGNRSRFHGLGDVSQAGFGLMVEGPLSRRGSVILAARHGFLDQLLKHASAGIGPRCNDYQGKLVFDVAQDHRISAMAIAGIDRFNISTQEAWRFGSAVSGNWRAVPFTIGAGWDAKWGTNLRSQVNLSQTVTEYRYKTQVLSWRETQYEDFSNEKSWSLLAGVDWQLAPRQRLKLGLEVIHQLNDENYRLPWHIDPFQHYVPELREKLRIEGTLLGLYASHTRDINARLSITLGGRADYSSLTKHLHFSPRASATWRLGTATYADLATGVYYQQLPMSILSQNVAHRSLPDQVSYHLIMTLRQALGAGIEGSLAVYSKWYDHMPIDPAVPQLFVLDEILNPDGFWFQHHEHLVATGTAVSRGAELVLRRRMAGWASGLIGASVSSARYRDGKGDWHDRTIDTRYSGITEGSLMITPTWRVSLRWTITGGPAHSEFDMKRSQQLRVGIYDSTQINTSHFLPYHALNIRIDKQFHFIGTAFSAYIVVWNLYDRQTVNTIYWRENANDDGIGTWLGRVIFGGLEYRI